MRGRLAGFSLDRLVRFLVRLGNDVEIVVKPRARAAGRARVKVAQAAGSRPFAVPVLYLHQGFWAVLAVQAYRIAQIPKEFAIRPGPNPTSPSTSRP